MKPELIAGRPHGPAALRDYSKGAALRELRLVQRALLSDILDPLTDPQKRAKAADSYVKVRQQIRDERKIAINPGVFERNRGGRRIVAMPAASLQDVAAAIAAEPKPPTPANGAS